MNGTVLGDSPAEFIAGPHRTSFQGAGLCASGEYWTFSDAAGELDVRSCKSTGGFSFAEPIERGAYGICSSTSSQEMISYSTLECYLPLQFMCICQSSGFKAGATRMPTSFAPSRSPSRTPSKAPTTPQPSNAPSGTPSRAPSRTPSLVPSRSPSQTPSQTPSKAPTTSQPSNAPTQSPTKLPTTLQPTTLAPTSKAPTSLAPTLAPTAAPTAPTPSTIVNILFSAGIAAVDGDYGYTAAASACSGAAAGVPGIKVSTCTSPAPFVSKIIGGVTTHQNAMMNANGVFHRSGTVLATSKASFYSSGLVNSLSSVGICSTSYWSFSAGDGSIDYSCPTDDLQFSWAETNGAYSFLPSGGGATGSCTSTAGAHVYTTIVDCSVNRFVICHCLGQTIF